MNKNSGLKWTIKNSKKQMPWIIALSVSNIVLALIGTILALASKFAIDAAQKAATSKTNCALQKFNYYLWHYNFRYNSRKNDIKNFCTKSVCENSGKIGNEYERKPIRKHYQQGI